MPPDPAKQHLARTALFVAWIAGGLALIGLTWVLTQDFYDNYWIQSSFVPVHPTPEYHAWVRYYESIRYLPALALGYAAVSVWAFRGRGGLAVACGAIFTCCPCLTSLCGGIGR